MFITIILHLLLILICNNTVNSVTLEEQFMKMSRQKRELLMYPYGSAIGLYLAFAVPLDLPEQDVLFSYNFEANYNLPNNMEQYAMESLLSGTDADSSLITRRSLRSINRKNAFNYIEDYLNRRGLDGRTCLLRTICEVGQSSITHNGILGNLIHTLFTPSSSRPENISEEYGVAEKSGASFEDCENLYSTCTPMDQGVIKKEVAMKQMMKVVKCVPWTAKKQSYIENQEGGGEETFDCITTLEESLRKIQKRREKQAKTTYFFSSSQ